ncbi:hypothetical protein ISS312_02597 [Alteromonas mediterranea]|nr:hypothetical protein ISS312_02597 [Alteromonas mediterranea]
MLLFSLPSRKYLKPVREVKSVPILMTTPLVFHPIYSQLDLPERHRFPIEKYVGIRDELIRRGIDKARFITPSPLDFSVLTDNYDR